MRAGEAIIAWAASPRLVHTAQIDVGGYGAVAITQRDAVDSASSFEMSHRRGRLTACPRLREASIYKFSPAKARCATPALGRQPRKTGVLDSGSTSL